MCAGMWRSMATFFFRCAVPKILGEVGGNCRHSLMYQVSFCTLLQEDAALNAPQLFSTALRNSRTPNSLTSLDKSYLHSCTTLLSPCRQGSPSQIVCKHVHRCTTSSRHSSAQCMRRAQKYPLWVRLAEHYPGNGPR